MLPPSTSPPAVNIIALSSLVDSLSVIVTVVATVAVSALPVTSPVRLPANEVAVNKPLLLLNVKLEPLLGGKSPVAAVVNNGKQVVSLDSSATVTAVPTEARATAMSPVPSKLVPPIFLAVASAVAVAARPTAMLAEPLKLVPPIVLAVVRVAAEPVVFWLSVPTVKI